MQTLEIIHRPPAPGYRGPARPAPLLFVHGAFSGAWIWDETFLPWFSAQGWDSYAVSLRGHGRSAGRERLDCFGIADYVEDVLEAADRCPAPPVLVGHSMGGMIVQRAPIHRRFPAAVLMASAPPFGLWESTLGLAWRDPYVFQQMAMLSSFGGKAIDPEAIRRAMFSDDVPPAEAARYEPLLQEESRRVLLDIGGWIPFPPLPARGFPFLVMGAERDLLIPPDQVRATARLVGAEPVILPRMGHTIMLEPGWRTAAERIADWVMERTAVAAV
ncbi:alpha/beta hydrolase [Azospirillum thermophilum]|uniref:Alpha/beta hydrolase n=1 Tax=Azospirillum thermophilum TaxID=2202148 RepID=A0A2S2CUD7_9PROT|nr:alpha/beta fold hydrolase [Azospirillum thermophilum]AWK88025.1 alpha/beta hydrolase [Azospirillum thermophilum]